MKFGLRTPYPMRSIKAKTTGKAKRTIKKAVNPFYGKKGMGFLKDPKRSAYNAVYSRTTFDAKDVSDALGGTSMASNKVYTTGPQQTVGGAPASGSPKPPVYKRPWFIILMLLLIGFILICVLFGEISDPAEESVSSQMSESLSSQIPSSSEANLVESSEPDQPEPESETEPPASESQEPEQEASQEVSQPEASSEPSIQSEERPASSQSEVQDTEPDTSAAAPIIIPPTASEAEPPASEVPASITYVLNTNTMKIHYPSCSSVDQIKPENYAETTDIEEALAAGYEPCKRCNPK